MCEICDADKCDLCASRESEYYLYDENRVPVLVEAGNCDYWEARMGASPAGYDSVSAHDVEHLKEAISDPDIETDWPAYLIAWEDGE